MAILLYRFISHFIYPGLWLSSFFKKRIALWIQVRKNWRENVHQISTKLSRPVLWVHVASLGEYEMARPLLRKFVGDYPTSSVLISFFSPSGYVHAKLEANCHKIYLPVDTVANMSDLIKMINPHLVVFFKYDLWFNLIETAGEHKIPMKILGYNPSIKRLKTPWYGTLLKNALLQQERIYTINGKGKSILNEMGLTNVEIGGDSRYLNVIQNANESVGDDILKKFSSQFKRVIVCGSVWPEDMEILKSAMNTDDPLGWILAPHDVSPSGIEAIVSALDIPFTRYSELEELKDKFENKALILDGIGKLSKAYQYGLISYVGGAFGKGLHNILEPAAYGIPVIFGPRHHRFPEAIDFIENKIGKSVTDAADFENLLYDFFDGRGFKGKSEIIQFIEQKAESTYTMYDEVLREFKFPDETSMNFFNQKIPKGE
nr:hypothetical protein [Saprospiraceae bacterium]